MGDLKPGWKRVRLGDVVDVVTEYWDRDPNKPERFVAGEHIDEGSLKVARWGMTSDVLVPPTFNRRFKAGDVLFHSRNLRKLARPDFSGITGEKLFVLRSKSQRDMTPELLPFLLQTNAFSDYVNSMWAGSTNKFLNKAPLIRYEFALPPLEEQRRLAKTLTHAFAARETMAEASASGGRVRASLVKSLYEGGTRGEERVQTPIGMRPKSWQVEPLGNRFTIQLGKMVSEVARSASGHTAYLRNANVQWNRLDLDDVATMYFTPQEREKFSLRLGDILACEGRHVGKSAMWREEIPGACYQKALHRLRAIGGDDPGFILHYLYYLSLTGGFAAVTVETTIPHLPAEKFRAMLFGFPSPAEQREVAQEIDAFDAAMARVEERHRHAGHLIRELTTWGTA